MVVSYASWAPGSEANPSTTISSLLPSTLGSATSKSSTSRWSRRDHLLLGRLEQQPTPQPTLVCKGPQLPHTAKISEWFAASARMENKGQGKTQAPPEEHPERLRIETRDPERGKSGAFQRAHSNSVNEGLTNAPRLHTRDRLFLPTLFDACAHRLHLPRVSQEFFGRRVLERNIGQRPLTIPDSLKTCRWTMLKAFHHPLCHNWIPLVDKVQTTGPPFPTGRDWTALPNPKKLLFKNIDSVGYVCLVWIPKNVAKH